MTISATGEFTTFGPAHLATLAITVLLAVALPTWMRKTTSHAVGRTIRIAIATALVGNELIYHYMGISLVGPAGFAAGYLPVHICGLSAYLTAWLLIRPSQGLYEVTYFWALAGTLQATLTPELASEFPSYWFIQYFVRHSGIIIGVVAATWGLKMRPRRWAPFRVFGVTLAYAAAVAMVNWLTGGNYMFLRHAPETQSPFFFLPWPWYLAFIGAVGLGMFWLLQMPFAIAEALSRRRLTVR